MRFVNTIFLFLVTTLLSSVAVSNPSQVFPENAFEDYWTGNAGWIVDGKGGVLQLVPVSAFGGTSPADTFATTLMFNGNKCFLVEHAPAGLGIQFIPDPGVTSSQCPKILKSMNVAATGPHAMSFILSGDSGVLASGEFKNSRKMGVELAFLPEATNRRSASPSRVPIKNYNYVTEVAPTSEKLAAQARAKAYRATLPDSMNQLYLVTESGLLTQLEINRFNSYDVRIHTRDAFNIDAGRKEGEIIGNVERVGFDKLKVRDALVVTSALKSSYRHCPKAMMSDAYTASIKPIVKAEGKQTDGAWKIRVLGGACKRPRTSQSRCEMVSCAEYASPVPEGQAKVVAFKSLAQAQALSKLRLASYQGETYAEAEAVADAAPQQTVRTGKAGERQSGYFERGGACGVISCDEQDTNQFIIDQVFGSN